KAPRLPSVIAMRLVLAIPLVAFLATPALAQQSRKPQPAAPVTLGQHDMPQPPASPKHAASSTLHGVRVADPYRWLEDGDDPAVRKWIKAQNAYAERMLAMMPAGKAMTRRVRELAITSTTRSAPQLAGSTLFY